MLGLFLLSDWGFWRVAAAALVIQLPPNLLLHLFSSSVSPDFSVVDDRHSMTDEEHRRIKTDVAEIAARAGVDPPAVWFTRSVPKSAVAGIFERTLVINPAVYNSVSRAARRALIAHELAHQYDQAARERLAADLAIFIPTGIANAAVVLTLLGRMSVDFTLAAYLAVSIGGTLFHARLSRVNERQADLLATDILGEKDSMLALCRELSRRDPDRRDLGTWTRLRATHPDWQRRRLALEKHRVRSHPRRISRLLNGAVGLILELALVSALAVVLYTTVGSR